MAVVTKKLGFLILAVKLVRLLTVCKVEKMAHKSILAVKTSMQVNTNMYVWNIIQRSSETEIKCCSEARVATFLS